MTLISEETNARILARNDPRVVDEPSRSIASVGERCRGAVLEKECPEPQDAPMILIDPHRENWRPGPESTRSVTLGLDATE